METALNSLSVFPTATIMPPHKVEDIGVFISEVFLQTNLLKANPAQHVFVVFYNRRAPESSLPVSAHIPLLPFAQHSFFDTCTEPWPTRTHPEFIDGKESTIKELVREFLFVSLFRACCESLAAENASRLATMERAEENIHSHLNSLTLTANQLRQELIDAELFDVVRQG
jgi:F-type H+-transporting ATPase subunit gamma